MRSLRLDDPRLVTLVIAVLLTAALWVAAWSAMGESDFYLVAACRAALFGGETPAALAAVLPEMSALRLFFETWAMWVLMMAAMMLPAMTAVIATYADVAAIEHRGALLFARVSLFALSYFALWALFSAGAAGAQLALRGSAWFSVDGSTAGPAAAGALLLIAGGYQFSKLKQSCLTKCRHPMQYLMAEWRPGFRGAVEIGLRHGLYCLGCCAALMGLMFVFGAMNLWWMAVIALYCAAEKILPGAERWGRFAGLAMLGGGAWMIGTQI